MFRSIIYFQFQIYLLFFLCSSCVPTFRPPIQLASEVVVDEVGDEIEEEEDNEEIDETDVPYDIRLDTMALLTCDSSSIPGDNFKLKAGAFLQEVYEKGGGVKLRSPFARIDRDDLKKYPYYNVTPALFFGSGAEGVLSDPYYSILSNIQLKNYLKDLSKGYVHQFGSKDIDFTLPLKNIDSRQLDEFLRLPLWATFVERGEKTPLLYLDDHQDTEIHGRSYEIDLQKEESFFTLGSVTETYPLLSKTDQWSCEHSFTVHRHEDVRYNEDNDQHEKGCNQNDEENKPLYELARILLGNDWFIDTKNLCISPKNRRDYCYRSKPERVEFSNDCRGVHKGYHCPHYFSICTISKLN